jgi:hypothetical protein
MLDFGLLKAPPNDGDILIEPHGTLLRHAVERNQRLIQDWHFPFGTIDLQDLRQSVRAAMTPDATTPCVVTGHQPEFLHPGVWAKHVVADRLAHLHGSRGVNLVVDNDAPKKLTLSTPVVTREGLSVLEIPYATAPLGVAYESLPALTPSACVGFVERLQAALDRRLPESMLPTFLDGIAHASPAGGLCTQMVAGRRAIDTAHGVDLIEHRVSRVWGGAFLATMILDASRFAAAYNAALADYRREFNVRGPDRPIADLRLAENRVELPLWSYRPGEVRRPVFVEVHEDRRLLFADERLIGTLGVEELRRSDAAGDALAGTLTQPLRPKALALTLWARLLLADVFIHGIGGAKYDRITDRIIRDYYGLVVPHMVCVSATLRLDLPARSVRLEDLRDARRQARDVVYNPQRYVRNGSQLHDLAAARQDLIEEARRLRAQRPQDHAARRKTFEAIRQGNHQMLALDTEVEGRLNGRVEQIRRHLSDRRIADGREYFVGLFPRRKLSDLAHRLHNAV